jgi:hypothetical protein
MEYYYRSIRAYLLPFHKKYFRKYQSRISVNIQICYLAQKVGSEEKQANIPSMYRPLGEECTLGTDDIMLLQHSYSLELL